MPRMKAPTSRRFAVATAIISALTAGLLVAPVAAASASTSDFVTRDGTELYLNGQPYTFVGVNAQSLTGCHSGRPDSQDVQDAYFAQLNAHTVTRTWAFEHLPSALEGIDRVVRTAEKYGTKVMLSLHEGAEYCGAPDYDANYYKGGYKQTLLPWIDQIVSKYKDSPAIMAWEISNEPILKAGGVNLNEFKAFLDTVAARIKQNDPNHLVASGTIAPYQGMIGNSAENYAYLHSSPNIDMVSLHEYDYQYNNGQGYSAIVSPHWAKTKAAADMTDKVAYVGEMGVSLSNGTMSAQERASVVMQKQNAYHDAGGVGAFYWSVLSDTNPNMPVHRGDVTNESGAARDLLIGSPVMVAISGYESGVSTPPATPEPTATPAPTATPTPTPKPTKVPTPIVTPTPKPTAVPSPSITPTPSTTPTPTPTPTPSEAAPKPSDAPGRAPLVVESPAPSPTPAPTEPLVAGEYDDDSLSYTDGWITADGAGKLGGTDSFSRVPGEAATVAFTGTSFDLLGTLDAHHGTATVAVDGVEQGEIDFYSVVRTSQQTVFTTAGLSPGEHTVTITVNGDGVVALDGLVVADDAPEPAAVGVQPGTYDDDAFSYTNAWKTAAGAGKFGGTDSFSRVPGEAATVTFTGTSFDLLGTLDAHHGTATVVIDGVEQGEIDLHSAARTPQQTVFSSTDLAPGAHTVTITVNGDGVVALDGFVVTR